MNSYKIYLTKNAEAAYWLSRGLREATPLEQGRRGDDCYYSRMRRGK